MRRRSKWTGAADWWPLFRSPLSHRKVPSRSSRGVKRRKYQEEYWRKGTLTNRIIWNSRQSKKTSNNKHEQPKLKLEMTKTQNQARATWTIGFFAEYSTIILLLSFNPPCPHLPMEPVPTSQWNTLTPIMKRAFNPPSARSVRLRPLREKSTYSHHSIQHLKDPFKKSQIC